MIENKLQFKIEREERTYQLIIPNQCPIGELFDILSEMRGYVFSKIKEHEELEKNKDEPPKEENPIEGN